MAHSLLDMEAAEDDWIAKFSIKLLHSQASTELDAPSRAMKYGSVMLIQIHKRIPKATHAPEQLPRYDPCCCHGLYS